MKTYKTITAQREELESLTCDLCGKQVPVDDWTHSEGDSGQFRIARTRVSLREGYVYPEGGSGEEVEYDICPECFKTKLIPWIESQGAHREPKEWYI